MYESLVLGVNKKNSFLKKKYIKICIVESFFQTLRVISLSENPYYLLYLLIALYNKMQDDPYCQQLFHLKLIQIFSSRNHQNRYEFFHAIQLLYFLLCYL